MCTRPLQVQAVTTEGRGSSPLPLLTEPCVFMLHLHGGACLFLILTKELEGLDTLLGEQGRRGGGEGTGRSHTCSRGQGHNGHRRHRQEHGHDCQGPAQGPHVHGQPCGRGGDNQETQVRRWSQLRTMLTPIPSTCPPHRPPSGPRHQDKPLNLGPNLIPRRKLLEDIPLLK